MHLCKVSKATKEIKVIREIKATKETKAMQAQQEAFLKAMTGGLSGNWSGPAPQDGNENEGEGSEDLEEIKKQLADLQSKLSKLK